MNLEWMDIYATTKNQHCFVEISFLIDVKVFFNLLSKKAFIDHEWFVKAIKRENHPKGLNTFHNHSDTDPLRNTPRLWLAMISGDSFCLHFKPTKISPYIHTNAILIVVFVQASADPTCLFTFLPLNHLETSATHFLHDLIIRSPRKS